MNLSDVAGRPVLDLDTATNIGKVADFVIDPVNRRIVGFQLANVKGPAHWLGWDAMNTLGADALTIDRPDVLTEPPEHSRGLRADKVIGGRVLTDSGRELRNLVDLEFDPDTGQITGLRIGDHSMPADALIGVGRYATVVVDPKD
jgi:sporulation protein YlmC with PRC-barrel domain